MFSKAIAGQRLAVSVAYLYMYIFMYATPYCGFPYQIETEFCEYLHFDRNCFVKGFYAKCSALYLITLEHFKASSTSIFTLLFVSFKGYACFSCWVRVHSIGVRMCGQRVY